MNVWAILKSSENNYIGKKICNLLRGKKKLVIKSMNMSLGFEINLKWKRWNITTTCTQNKKFYC